MEEENAVACMVYEEGKREVYRDEQLEVTQKSWSQ